MIGCEHIGHKAEGKVRGDCRKPEVIRIEHGLLAAALPHVEQRHKGDASAKSPSPVTRSHRDHVKVTDLGLRQPLIRRGSDVVIAGSREKDAFGVYAGLAQKQPGC